MPYMTSRTKLNVFIEETIKKTCSLGGKVFCDLFAGISSVGRRFKPQVGKIIANDKRYYNYVIAKHCIGNNEPLSRDKQLIYRLRQLRGVEGLITQQFGGKHLTEQNAMWIDAVRQKIEEWKEDLSEGEYYFLLCSLLYSTFRFIDNELDSKFLLIEAPYVVCDTESEIYQEDANELIKSIEGDILYLDPPYNNKDNDNTKDIVLNTIARYAKTDGRAKSKSVWTDKNKVYDELDTLIKHANFKYVFLNYNSDGLLKAETIEEILGKYGQWAKQVQVYEVSFRLKHRFNPNNRHRIVETLYTLKKA